MSNERKLRSSKQKVTSNDPKVTNNEQKVQFPNNITKYSSSRPEVFYKKSVLGIFAKFTRKIPVPEPDGIFCENRIPEHS